MNTYRRQKHVLIINFAKYTNNLVKFDYIVNIT